MKHERRKNVSIRQLNDGKYMNDNMIIQLCSDKVTAGSETPIVDKQHLRHAGYFWLNNTIDVYQRVLEYQ